MHKDFDPGGPSKDPPGKVVKRTFEPTSFISMTTCPLTDNKQYERHVMMNTAAAFKEEKKNKSTIGAID